MPGWHWLLPSVPSTKSYASRGDGTNAEYINLWAFGKEKDMREALERLYWYGPREDINIWIMQCDTCAATKPPSSTPREPLGKMTVGAPLDRLRIYILGPLPLTPRGNRNNLVVTDHFTK